MINLFSRTSESIFNPWATYARTSFTFFGVYSRGLASRRGNGSDHARFTDWLL